jgi:ATP-binding cassette subfamily F protein uup
LRQLHKLREEKRSRLSNQHGKVNFSALGAGAESKLVVEATELSKSFGNRVIIKNFSTRILKGDRIGILGPNGAGKSTLAKMLIRQLTPDEGKVRLGPTVEMIYLDQMQASLNPDKTLWETLCETGGDHVMVQGHSRHVVAYLKDFLFQDKQVKALVSILSGGERNRLALAKALTSPANLMVLDEPTNDLDMDTLDLLQEMLSDYPGTLIIISHDRDFLDKLTTSIIAVEGDGTAVEYVGGYDDYIRQRGDSSKASIVKKKSKPTPEKPRLAAPSAKLTFKEQYELKQLAERIKSLSAKKTELELRLEDPELYNRDPAAFQALTAEHHDVLVALDQAETRWLELEMKGGG